MNDQYLRQQIQNVDVLLDLEPEEFGAHIVEAIKRDAGRMSLPDHVRIAFYPDAGPEIDGFPRNRANDAQSAIYEAWAWLEAQGFLIWPDGANGRNGWRVLSRRAARLSPGEYPDFAAARAIPHGVFHESIRAEVWSDFVRGRYASAVFHACRQVEIAVREAAQIEENVIGVGLMRLAFNPNNGALTDMESEIAEREARAHLFAGFYGSYRNPVAHRDVNIDDPIEALEIIFLASHLLRIVEAREVGAE